MSSHHSILESTTLKSVSMSSSTHETMSLPPTSSVSSVISSNLKPLSSSNLISSTTKSSTGGISINFSSRNSTTNSSSVLSSSPKVADPGPLSLPSWGVEKRSVKELAASLARQQSQEESGIGIGIGKKKSDSLPRNASPPTTKPPPPPTEIVEQPQGLHANCFGLIFLFEHFNLVH